MRSLFAAIALLFSLAAASCGSERAPARAPSAEAQQNASEPRIVALSPAIGVILRDLGFEHRIVARHGFDEVLDPALPIAGDQAGIDYEVLARARPTHVFLEWGSRDLPERLTTLAADRGWALRSFPLLSLEDIRAAAVELSRLPGGESTPDRAAALLAAMDRAWSPRSGLGERAGRTLILYWTNPPGAAGPGSYHHQILERLGVPPALETGPPYASLDAESLRRLDPDTILLLSPGANPDKLTELLGPVADWRIRAVEAGRVGLVSHPLSQTACTAMVEVADEMVKALDAAAAGRSLPAR